MVNMTMMNYDELITDVEQHEVFNTDILNKSAVSQYKRRMPNFPMIKFLTQQFLM